MSKVIGIYGDSYAKLNLEENNRLGRGKAWFEVLAELLGAETINNFGQGGNSLLQVYTIYEETKKLNDINIVLIPFLERIYSSALDNFYINDGKNWFSNFESAKIAQKRFNRDNSGINYPADIASKILESLLVYYEYWKDLKSDIILNKALANNMINSSEENVIFLSVNGELFDNDFSLFQLSKWELNMLGWIEKYTNNAIDYGRIKDNLFFTDARLCHLSEENNLILAHSIKNAIDKKEKVLRLNPENFVVPKEPLEYYGRWIPI